MGVLQFLYIVYNLCHLDNLAKGSIPLEMLLVKNFMCHYFIYLKERYFLARFLAMAIFVEFLGICSKLHVNCYQIKIL